MYTSVPALRQLQQTFTDLRARGLGKAKSAAIDSLRENLVEALRLGFSRRRIWEALREVGYEGSYRYFRTKLHRLRITRSNVTSPTSLLATRMEARRSTEPAPLDEVEAQRRRLEEARRRGDIYRNPKPEPKKIFVFNRENG